MSHQLFSLLLMALSAACELAHASIDFFTHGVTDALGHMLHYSADAFLIAVAFTHLKVKGDQLQHERALLAEYKEQQSRKKAGTKRRPKRWRSKKGKAI